MTKSINYHESEIRVRYGETDQMGVVYHGNYAQYFEIGRTEWLRKFGLSYKEMESNGLMLPVVSLSINFKKSAVYDEVLKVKTQLKKRPSARIEFDYEIINEKGQLITTGNSVLVFMDMSKNKPTRCPQYVLDKLQN